MRFTQVGLQALPANIRLGWKGLPGTNALAYYEGIFGLLGLTVSTKFELVHEILRFSNLF
jgi:hypothetical protein